MILYSYIEESYCIQCKHNVAIEYVQHQDGEKRCACIQKRCQKDEPACAWVIDKKCLTS